ncbi:hemin uptake protein HemP [Pelagibacterium montanilacus]|uniref:hemin uptake protein HemP n=1 Tax=Pelagibacterium montanilacus TaxID=2185280 RepID=UPI000F8E5E56|nr:hemin uptake protein HemP [Pelagibacterium montanilacus]
MTNTARPDDRPLSRPEPDRSGVIPSHKLFGQAREVAIDHDGTVYRLRITRQGKLILNK